MKVFVTGASGWIGSATIPYLLAAGHQVEGLARSDASAAKLEAQGVAVRRGDLDDLDAIRAGAEASDAVVHLANKHDWANPANSNAAERAAVDTIGQALLGSDRPFLFAAGVAFAPGTVVTEDAVNPAEGAEAPRGGSERLAMDYAERGVHAVSLRFAPTVHGEGDHGFIALIAQAARDRGVSGYVGDGENAWAAVNHFDAGDLVTKALETASAGTALHVVAEEAVSTRDIAAALGDAMGLPVESIPADRAQEHFGFIGGFFSMDLRASSAATKERYDWTPSHPTLLEDIAAGYYSH